MIASELIDRACGIMQLQISYETQLSDQAQFLEQDKMKERRVEALLEEENARCSEIAWQLQYCLFHIKLGTPGGWCVLLWAEAGDFH